MNSSILRSNRRLWTAFVALILAFASGAAYTIWINPEVHFWKGAYALTVAHASEISDQQRSKVVLAGDSSCAFQIDARVLSKEFDLPAVNGGMHAGLGLRALVAMAVPMLKSGDTLLLHFQPELLMEENEIPPMAFQALVATGALWKQKSSPIRPLGKYGIHEPFLALRPGLYNAATMLGKLLFRRPLYRYSLADLDRDGTVSVESTENVLRSGAPRRFEPKDAIRRELARWQEEAAATGIRILYVLPVKLVTEATTTDWKESSAHALKEIEKYFPVYEDGRLGVELDAEKFADTALHFEPGERARRTRMLGPTIQELFPLPPSSSDNKVQNQP